MRKLLSTSIPDAAHVGLLLVRLCAGALMLTHGIPKLSKLLSGAEIQFADPFGFGPTASFLLVIFAEFFCTLLVMIGLATRLAVVPLIITMLTATLYAHANDPFGVKEKPLLFLVIFVGLLFFGSGRYSVDRILEKRR
jgi:putative oxidoreductase